uniref:SCAN box domain-containing protein n=1 Tax=Pseudonaja textilis TaxID=8673 RepID=A0A670Z8F0_PSETE
MTLLLPGFRQEAKEAFDSLSSQERGDYGKVKAAILRGEALAREKQRRDFRQFCYQEAEGPRGVYRHLQELCWQWLKAERCSKEEILELLVLEQFLTVLPPGMQSWVRAHGPETCTGAVLLAEEFLSKRSSVKQEEEVKFLVMVFRWFSRRWRRTGIEYQIKEQSFEDSWYLLSLFLH